MLLKTMLLTNLMVIIIPGNWSIASNSAAASWSCSKLPRLGCIKFPIEVQSMKEKIMKTTLRRELGKLFTKESKSSPALPRNIDVGMPTY